MLSPVRTPQGDNQWFYLMAARSRASRIADLRGNNRGSFVGGFVAWLNEGWQTLVFESRHELMTGYLLLSTPGLQDLHEQPPRVHFKGLNGLPSWHTFDFLATVRGRRYAVACKFKNRAERIHFREQLALIKAQFKDFADEVLLVTEEDYSRERALEAELYHFIGREVDEEADVTVLALISTLVGTTTIGTIVRATGLKPARAWRSIVRLAGRRVIRVDAGHRIDNYESPICRRVR